MKLFKMTFSARVSLLSCQVMCFCTIFFYLSILMRLIVGPFTHAGVVFLHYWLRLSLVAFVTMLTFKTVLTTLFILDFNKMTSIPEKSVINFMWMITLMNTLFHLGLEIYLRHTLGYHHFGRLCFNLYLGKVCLNAK